jgi:septal ring factor EnvC (AmiA/AmiB activator)
MIRAYLAGGILAAFLALAGGLWWQSSTIGVLRDDNARLTRSAAALEDARAQARLAATVAQAEAGRQRAKAAKYEQVKEAFRQGDFNATLPDDFRVLLNRILRPDQN